MADTKEYLGNFGLRLHTIATFCDEVCRPFVRTILVSFLHSIHSNYSLKSRHPVRWHLSERWGRPSSQTPSPAAGPRLRVRHHGPAEPSRGRADWRPQGCRLPGRRLAPPLHRRSAASAAGYAVPPGCRRGEKPPPTLPTRGRRKQHRFEQVRRRGGTTVARRIPERLKSCCERCLARVAVASCAIRFCPRGAIAPREDVDGSRATRASRERHGSEDTDTRALSHSASETASGQAMCRGYLP